MYSNRNTSLLEFWQDHVYQTKNRILNRKWQKYYWLCDLFKVLHMGRGGVHHTSQIRNHIAASQFKSKSILVNDKTTAELINTIFVYDAYQSCYKSCLTSQKCGRYSGLISGATVHNSNGLWLSQ